MVDDADGMLHLKAQRGLPPPVLDKVQVIPVGKGMAGIAAERREPVQVCNLQTDDSGVARPGAKMTQMEGSLAAPMLKDGAVRGTAHGTLPVPAPGTADPAAAPFAEDPSAAAAATLADPPRADAASG